MRILTVFYILFAAWSISVLGFMLYSDPPTNTPVSVGIPHDSALEAYCELKDAEAFPATGYTVGDSVIYITSCSDAKAYGIIEGSVQP